MVLVSPNGVPLETDKPDILEGALSEYSKKPVFYESMTKVMHMSGGLMRIWRTCTVMPEYADQEVMEWVKQIPATATMPDIVKHMGFLKGISAIELLDKFGLGGIAYYEWDTPNTKTEESETPQ